MKIKRKTFVGGVIAALCACTALTFGTVFSLSGAGNKAYADTSANGSASVLSIDSSTGTVNTNFENKIQGAQTEYVYLGHDITIGDTTQAIDAPMKWRVLTKNDTKYGSGKNLLLQTETIYSFGYNLINHKDYLFWGTSWVRSFMNGGTTTNGESIQYYNAADGSLNTWASPLVNKIMVSGDSDFLNAIQGTNSYITRAACGNAGYHGFATNVFTAYPFSNANATVTRSTDTDVTGGLSGVLGDKVSGDRMFFLDIEDVCNTAAYGFTDSTSGKTYYQLIAEANPSMAFNGWQNGYPTYIASNNILTDALKTAPGTFTLLRNPVTGKTNGTDVGYCASIYGAYVASGYNCGNMLGGREQKSTSGPSYSRPATVLDLSKVVYANSSTGNVSDTLTDVTGSNAAKPEYKLYIKDKNYSNTGFAPVITSANGKVKVTFKNNSGKAGNAVLLLQDKNATDGSVSYQAVKTMASGNSEQTVEFTLPSSITYKDYTPTVMLTSANTTSAATMATESVYATYTQD
ncbi:MAG: hypothetical protein K2G26_00835, partial [Clostridia bacterium]|nr:hypothetical protein [Clostridia bacterium]